MIILDTSGIIAAYNRRETEHTAAHKILTDTEHPMAISPLVLAEVDYLATKYLGVPATVTILRELEQTATIAPFLNEDLRASTDIVHQYASLNIGLTDASNVLLAGRYKSTRILTLDNHYRAIRPQHGTAFTILPTPG